MSTVADHYAQLLSEHYIWMFGISFEEKVAEQKTLLERVLDASQPSVPHGLALDLGAGPGFQSIALAELGFVPVIAVDTSTELLAELKSRSGSFNIETLQADIASLDTINLPLAPTIAVCMGDTLTHLSSRDEVERFLASVFAKLAPDGLFVLTWRDLTSTLTGIDRFITVRSDENKTMHCFFEYESAGSVVVHDLIHIRQPEGWTLHQGSYRKLRLSIEWVIASLSNSGFRVDLQEPGRMCLIAARKP